MKLTVPAKSAVLPLLLILSSAAAGGTALGTDDRYLSTPDELVPYAEEVRVSEPTLFERLRRTRAYRASLRVAADQGDEVQDSGRENQSRDDIDRK